MATPPRPPTAPPGLTVLFEDNHLLIIDKPAGLLCQAAAPGDDHAVERARAFIKARDAKPGNVHVALVHRLDRNTSGVLVLAKTSKAASRLSAAFARRGEASIDKRYIAVVAGAAPDTARLVHRLAEDGHGVRVDPGGKEAVLELRTLARCPTTSLVEVRLLTGRKHQIRAQLAAAGHPLLGDRRYGGNADAFHRPALHARAISLVHPVRQTELRVVAPLPADLLGLLGRLGLTAPMDPDEVAAKKWE